MSSSTRRRRADASAISSIPNPTAKAKEKTKSVLSSLVVAKTREYERKKQELIAFTEKIMKKKITGAVKKYITDNLDTIYDFISQLEHHPSVARAFPIEIVIRNKNQHGLRMLVDLNLPKTALPDKDPIPPELLSQFKTNIKSHIMDFVKTTHTTKRRIFIDIFYNKLHQVEDINAPQDPYIGDSAEYYSTFTDAHLGVRSANSGLEGIRIIQSGLKDDVLLAILENLNGKNYCATRVFRKVCDKLRGNMNQTARELRPFVSFPEKTDSPDPENPNPIIDGRAINSINMMEFLPILLSNFYTYLEPLTDSDVATSEKVTTMRNLILILTNLLKVASRTDDTRGPPYYKDKVLKVGVTLFDLIPLAEILISSIGSTIFSEFCTFAPTETDRGFKLYLKQKITRTSLNLDNPLDLASTVKTLLAALVGRNMIRFANIELRVIQSRPEFRYILTVNLTDTLEPVVARPTEIPTSSVLNIPPREVSRLPSSERVVIAELAGKNTSKKIKYKKHKTSKN